MWYGIHRCGHRKRESSKWSFSEFCFYVKTRMVFSGYITTPRSLEVFFLTQTSLSLNDKIKLNESMLNLVTKYSFWTWISDIWPASLKILIGLQFIILKNHYQTLSKLSCVLICRIVLLVEDNHFHVILLFPMLWSISVNLSLKGTAT